MEYHVETHVHKPSMDPQTIADCNIMIGLHKVLALSDLPVAEASSLQTVFR